MSTRRALALSFIDRYAGLFISIGTSMVIARLLSPSQIGVFSVTMVLVSVIATLRDMGAGQYLVQERELTQDRIRSTWALQLGIGLFLALVLALLASPMSRFYKEPTMEVILWILAFNFAVNPFGSITVAWWSREMQFQWIALMRFSGAVANASVAILLAWQGYGPVSLAWASLATTVASIAVAIALRPGNLPWLPGFREIRHVFSFGSRLTTISIVGTLSNGAPEAFLGRLQDMEQTGLLSRANGLVSMFDRLVMDAVGPVTLPLFARKAREGEALGELYLRALSLITVLGWSFLACLAITAYPVIRILYGGQWDGAVTMTQILCLSTAMALPMSISENLLIAKGFIKSVLSIVIVAALVKIIASLIGAYSGLHTLGWMLIASAVITSGIWLGKVKQVLDFKWRDILNVIIPSSLIALATSSPLLLLAISVGFRGKISELPQFIVGGLLAAIIFALSARILKHPIYDEVDKIIKRILRR